MPIGEVQIKHVLLDVLNRHAGGMSSTNMLDLTCGCGLVFAPPKTGDRATDQYTASDWINQHIADEQARTIADLL